MSVVDSLYRPFLESAGLIINEEGHVRYPLDDTQSVAVKAGDLPMVLPTPDRLKSSSALQGVVAFHPLSENIIRGESPVLRKTRTAVVSRLTNTTLMLVLHMLEIAADVDYQTKLKVTESEFLRCVPNGDEKLLNAFAKVADSVTPEGDNRFMRLYFKRGGIWKGEKHSRVAIVNFPLIEALHTEDKTLFGVKLRVADKAQLKALFEFILPGSMTPDDNYSYGSSNKSAPYFDALAGSYLAIANALNKQIKRLKKHISNYEELYIDTSWASEIAKLDALSLEIPPLPGNEGEQGIEEKHNTEVASAAALADDNPHRVGSAPVTLGNSASAFAAAMGADNAGAVTTTPVAPATQPTMPTTLGNSTTPVKIQNSGLSGAHNAPTMPTTLGTPAPVMQQPVLTHTAAATTTVSSNGKAKWNEVAPRVEQPMAPPPQQYYQPSQQYNTYGQPQPNSYGAPNSYNSAPAVYYDQWGRPMQPQQQVDQWGRPIGGYGQPQNQGYTYPDPGRVLANYN